MIEGLNHINTMTSVGSTVVKHSTHNPKIEGLNPTPGTGREKKGKKVYNTLIRDYLCLFQGILKGEASQYC
jgi:hypothetical protein